MFFGAQASAGRTELLLVENESVEGRIKQRVLLRLGGLDQLLVSDPLVCLLASLGRVCTRQAVLGADERGHSVTTRMCRIALALHLLGSGAWPNPSKPGQPLSIGRHPQGERRARRRHGSRSG